MRPLQISESKGVDGLYVDVGTQTHSFRSAPFKGRTTLADVMVDKPPKLRLQLQAERVNSRHNRASCVFSFLCGHSFLRREFSTHFRSLRGKISIDRSLRIEYIGEKSSGKRLKKSFNRYGPL